MKAFRDIYFIRFGARIISLLACLFLGACEKSTSSLSGNPLLDSQIAKGKAVYSSSCTACHNINPRLPGSLGPEVFGSSKELIEARVLSATYPVGYKPKRETHQMVAMPHLKNEIENLAAFLNFSEKN